jgi:hypothetical protein
MLVIETLNPLPDQISDDRKDNADGEPFRVEAWSRIGTFLTEPICADRLNSACQKNKTETCRKQDH